MTTETRCRLSRLSRLSWALLSSQRASHSLSHDNQGETRRNSYHKGYRYILIMKCYEPDDAQLRFISRIQLCQKWSAADPLLGMQITTPANHLRTISHSCSQIRRADCFLGGHDYAQDSTFSSNVWLTLRGSSHYSRAKARDGRPSETSYSDMGRACRHEGRTTPHCQDRLLHPNICMSHVLVQLSRSGESEQCIC